VVDQADPVSGHNLNARRSAAEEFGEPEEFAAGRWRRPSPATADLAAAVAPVQIAYSRCAREGRSQSARGGRTERENMELMRGPFSFREVKGCPTRLVCGGQRHEKYGPQLVRRQRFIASIGFFVGQGDVPRYLGPLLPAEGTSGAGWRSRVGTNCRRRWVMFAAHGNRLYARTWRACSCLRPRSARACLGPHGDWLIGAVQGAWNRGECWMAIAGGARGRCGRRRSNRRSPARAPA